MYVITIFRLKVSTTIFRGQKYILCEKNLLYGDSKSKFHLHLISNLDLGDSIPSTVVPLDHYYAVVAVDWPVVVDHLIGPDWPIG